MKHFLAFSYNMHDSSVSIADERRVRLVLEAERYFGDKKKRCSHAEMEQLVAEALRHCGISIEDIDGVACTAYLNDHLPEHKQNCHWRDEHPVTLAGKTFDALVLNHHLAHAAIVYGFPGVEDVAIDVVDGGGDFGDTHRIYRYQAGRITQLDNAPIHDRFSSRFYDLVSRHLYGQIMCEGKLMALAAMGEPREVMMRFLDEHLEAFHDMTPDDGLALLAREYPVASYRDEQRAFDLAASTQHLFERLRCESVEALPGDARQVLLAGGGTLNILANTRVRDLLAGERELLIPPCCDDTGQSLGALLYYCHEERGCPVTAAMPFLGYSDGLDQAELTGDDVSDELVDHLCSGGVVFLHNGQSEIGPRALGHRSILARPSQRNRDLLNNVIKGREFYRPVAPIVPIEEVSRWFEWEGESRYMLFAGRARDATWVQAQGVCHYDGTARVQTIESGEHPFLHRLLMHVGEVSGCPILINTSLNPRGLPILSRREDTHRFRDSLSGLPIRVVTA
ncbi:carbamoyltransferase C-terminal domain-containing protein [Haliangium sp.]|uniref:carbamoyltransferase C-terminal domain-containing protein n=1 Tax=Haliangium sp. TaxID=2663208 RepID=UPI003D0DD239